MNQQERSVGWTACFVLITYDACAWNCKRRMRRNGPAVQCPDAPISKVSEAVR